MKVGLELIEIEKPAEVNVILGQAHFIKTVEDLYEVLAEASPTIEFGIAFCESSGKALVRVEGNNEELKKIASLNALKIGCGHMFIIVLKNAYPVNVLNRIKRVSEVCTIFCATANPVKVVVACAGEGRAFLGVIDGISPKGIEGSSDIEERKNFLRKIGYKR
ncbi:MAG: adenosine monophosphate-protein transferase [Candidatus Omnitrophica bacterium 4484_70.1]|nr:MAG: adenosine monophosphate-protein transferase [Candidatus Omnitrophica bacterium 4484_70.1]